MTKEAWLIEKIRNVIIELVHYSEEFLERVKELLVYNELNLTEVAYLMHSSSVHTFPPNSKK